MKRVAIVILACLTLMPVAARASSSSLTIDSFTVTSYGGCGDGCRPASGTLGTPLMVSGDEASRQADATGRFQLKASATSSWMDALGLYDEHTQNLVQFDGFFSTSVPATSIEIDVPLQFSTVEEHVESAKVAGRGNDSAFSSWTTRAYPNTAPYQCADGSRVYSSTYGPADQFAAESLSASQWGGWNPPLPAGPYPVRILLYCRPGVTLPAGSWGWWFQIYNGAQSLGGGSALMRLDGSVGPLTVTVQTP